MCGKRTNSKCVCEAFNLNAILIIISLFRLPLPVALKVAVVCCCSVPTFCTAEDEEGERWHRDYWEDVGRFKRVKITRDRFTLDFLCCISFLLLLTKNWRLNKLSYLVCRNLILFCATNHPQLLFCSCLCRFILVSEIHWRGSTICV
jgi:hypothetical protein